MRTSCRRPLPAILSALGCALSAGAAHAAGPTPVRVELKTPDGCADADEFVRRLSERVPVRVAGADEPAREVTVVVTRSGGNYRGSFESGSFAGAESREVIGSYCDEVLTALALSLSLALEDDSPEPETEHAQPETEHANNASDDTPRKASPVPPERDVNDGRPGDGWSIAAGGWFEALALSTMVGPQLDLERRFGEVGLRLRLGYLLEATRESPLVELNMPLAGLDLCYAFGHGSVRFLPCATIEAGLAMGRGRELAVSDQASLLFGAAGPMARLQWAWSSDWSVELQAAGLATWARPAFTTLPGPRTEVSTENFGAAAGLSLRYWF